MSGEYVGHPFDLTKTRLQTAAPGSYTGAIDVVKKTLARDGVKGYVRGSTPDPYMISAVIMLTNAFVTCVSVCGLVRTGCTEVWDPLLSESPRFSLFLSG